MVEMHETTSGSTQNPTYSPHEVLDPVQLRRIEATHRGFLYQHLYAVGCLLRLAITGAKAVTVERDEDVEVAAPQNSVYLQIKTRTRTLQRGDVRGALERFEEIRNAHRAGRRSGVATFRIVSSVPPSAALLKDLKGTDWPVDVHVSWPNGPIPDEYSDLPPAWPDLPTAIAWCVEAARAVPFAAMAPETLVWKLAARVHFASTGGEQGRPTHSFSVVELPGLFEQIVEQFQDFPTVPESYRPQANEPSLDDPKPVRIVTGFSGAGKTAWAAQVARHCAAPTAYFDVGDLPGSAVATSLARELAARFLGGHGREAGAVILATASGLEMLRALDRRIEISPTPIVVIDNAQRSAARDLVEITRACTRVHFVFLAQPWEGLAEAEALFAERAEWLAGWDTDTVAEEFAENSCMIDPATAERWRVATGGMPLFVKNAARLTASLCGGNASQFADEVETELHSAATVQETILGRVVAALSTDGRAALAALSLSTVPLAREEVDRVLGALSSPRAPWGRALRELSTCGGLQFFPDGRLKIHDALRVLGRALQSNFPESALLAARTALRDLLLESLEKEREFVRLGIWLRLLPATGDYKTLVDVATNEFFHEFGNMTDLKDVLEKALDSVDLDDEGKFYTLDALALWDWQYGEREEAYSRRLAQMAALVQKGTLGIRERVALAMKQMTSAATKNDAEGVTAAFLAAEGECRSDPLLMRILRYNHAVALFHLGRYRDAELEAEFLYLEYFQVLGLEPEDVIATNPPEIIAALGGELSEHKEDMKRLADCLDLYSRSRREHGFHSGLAALHALKFYAMAGAYRSAVKIGQEAVDDSIGMGDVEGARQIMEGHLLPLVSHFELTANLVPVCAQYAVVLAYCGDAEAAHREMRRLQPFTSSLSPGDRRELKNQTRLIEAINLGLIEGPRPPRARLSAPEKSSPPRQEKIGRNAPCPCGSGKKSKKCCYR